MVHQTEQTVIAERTRPVSIRWTAVLAGLVAVIAILWLMSVLGAAIGMSIADATDAESLGKGLGYAVIGWMLLTGLVAFFVGGILTVRASGFADTQTGMLHGFTMWAATIVVMMVLSYWGVAALINTGSSIIDTAVNASANAVGRLDVGANGREDSRSNATSATGMLNTRISARLKREAAKTIAAQENANITEEEAKQAIEQLDSQTLQEVAIHLIAGETEAAKDTLAVHTNLSNQQIEGFITGVQEDIKKQVDEFKDQANETLETATTYAQGVIWTEFIAMLLSLIAAIAGALFGASSVERLHSIAVTRQTTS